MVVLSEKMHAMLWTIQECIFARSQSEEIARGWVLCIVMVWYMYVQNVEVRGLGSVIVRLSDARVKLHA